MKNRINPVFGLSSLLLIAFVLWGALSPDSLASKAEQLFHFTADQFGWYYLLSVTFFIVFCLSLAFSRYGTIKLGKDRDQPEFSYFSWIGMLFSAGFGVGLVFWGVAEPMVHFMEPPGAATAQSLEAAEISMRYSMFHWGIHQWSVFTVVGLVMAYFQFRKNYKGLISAVFIPLIGKRCHEKWGYWIDVLSVIATVMGVSSSLGMGILQINGGLNFAYGLPKSVGMQLTITAVLLCLYLLSATTGLQRGIKWLSNLNLGMALGLLLFVLMVGPTLFILKGLTVGFGGYVQNFIQMSFNLNSHTSDSWVKEWTVLYWAWVISWAPFVGAFIARISRGRTIREFVFGVLFVPPLVAVVWMAVFGGTALHMQLLDHYPIGEAVQKDVPTAFFFMLQHLPFSSILTAVAIVLIVTFLVTSADSATFALGMMTSNGSLNPSSKVKFFWGLLISAIASVLLISSGLEGLQTASLVAALPFTFIMFGMCASLYKSLRTDKNAMAQTYEKPKQKAVS